MDVKITNLSFQESLEADKRVAKGFVRSTKQNFRKLHATSYWRAVYHSVPCSF